MRKYFTGGLQQKKNKKIKIIKIGGTEYVIDEKFKSSLRESIIDWGTFLEIYKDDLDYSNLYEHVVEILNIKENDNIKELIIPLLKEIYELPAKAHMACMIKQFVIYEPVMLSIKELFHTIRKHYEWLFEKFIIARNKYINEKDTINKINDWEKMLKKWNDLNNKFNLNSSSPILFFLNPPPDINSGINFEIEGKEKLIDELLVSISKFKYPGFCPKEAHKRLKKLIKFPVDYFSLVIKDIDKNILLPD